MRDFIPAMFLSAACVLLAACSQSEGELCQIDSDCQSGLKCDRALDTDMRGVCRNPKDIQAPATSADSGTEPKIDGGVGNAEGDSGEAMDEQDAGAAQQAPQPMTDASVGAATDAGAKPAADAALVEDGG